MAEEVISAKKLIKKYGSFTAVDGIDFAVRAGECFGMLGPNGAGKTSTVKMIHCASPVTEGDLCVFGMNVGRFHREMKARIGVCEQEDSLDPDFSVHKNLLTFSRYFGISAQAAKSKAEELLRFMGIWERRNDEIRALSGGLKRRLMIARALVNDPELLILDEPTTGLDPQSRHQVWDRVRTLRKQGKTILLTTHYMHEAEALCDRIVIMDHGKILVEGAPRALIEQHLGREVVEVWGYPEALLSRAKEKQWTHEADTDRLFIYHSEPKTIFDEIARDFQVDQCMVRLTTLEDLFLKMTGRALRE